MGIISNGNTVIDNGAIDANEVDTTQLATGAVETAKIADSQITLAKLSATGTKDATTFLRGDNTFAAAGGGKVLQVVAATDSTIRTTSSSSFTAASNTLSVNITPSSTSNKVLLLVQNGMFCTDRGWIFTIFRGGTGGTNLAAASGVDGFFSGQYSSNGEAWAAMFLDSPNTTSSTNYQLFVKERTTVGDGVVSFNTTRNGDGSTTNSLIAMEIDGS